MFITVLNTLAQSPGPSPPATTGGGGGLIIFLPFVLLLFWMMRKQGRQRRQHMELVASIQVGDEVETVAGMFGRVRRADEDALYVELAPSVEVKMLRGAVRRKVNPIQDGS
jgi:preprotein translocase subunit YajC